MDFNDKGIGLAQQLHRIEGESTRRSQQLLHVSSSLFFAPNKEVVTTETICRSALGDGQGLVRTCGCAPYEAPQGSKRGQWGQVVNHQSKVKGRCLHQFGLFTPIYWALWQGAWKAEPSRRRARTKRIWRISCCVLCFFAQLDYANAQSQTSWMLSAACSPPVSSHTQDPQLFRIKEENVLHGYGECSQPGKELYIGTHTHTPKMISSSDQRQSYVVN